VRESLPSNGSGDRGAERMNHTAFPATPKDVAALTVQEFTFDLDQLDAHRAPSLARICGLFIDDANRALVWWIRFEAFRNWCAASGIVTRSTSDAWIVRDAREAAASFPLNHLWEFDPMDFARAVEGMAARRASAGVDR
jgi:hypothetical protein